MTRDNLMKRHLGKPICCTFCNENESIDHLFFRCIVAENVWRLVSQFFELQLGHDYLSISRFWAQIKSMLLLIPFVLPSCGAFGNIVIAFDF
jgi:hypothetical protein